MDVGRVLTCPCFFWKCTHPTSLKTLEFCKHGFPTQLNRMIPVRFHTSQNGGHPAGHHHHIMIAAGVPAGQC